MEERILPIKRYFVRKYKNAGHSCISYALEHDAEKEARVTALMATIFENAGRIPLFIPIDTVYQYCPGNAGLVRKIEATNQEIEDVSRYVVILSGFAESAVFTPQVLADVPNQFNSGLNQESPHKDFGKKLSNYAHWEVGRLLFDHQGYLPSVLDSMNKNSRNREMQTPDEDARLLQWYLDSELFSYTLVAS